MVESTDFERTQMFLSSLGLQFETFSSVPKGKTIEVAQGYSGRRGVFLLKTVFAFDDNGKFLEWRLCEY